jgi:hypothetical protein
VSQETTNRSFDELARALASGDISRRRAIKLMGAALVGGTLASLGIREASAAPGGCKRNGKSCKNADQCCSENCVNGTCAAACPSGYTQLSNGTCAKPCGTEFGQCDSCGGLCAGANNGGGYCIDVPSSSQSPCAIDDECTTGELCVGIVCVRAPQNC